MFNNWETFWAWVLIIGGGAFALLVLAIIPLGARDIRRMFAKLDRQKSETNVDENEE